MKIYDPYKIIDPTIGYVPPVQARSYSGRFNGASILSNPDFENTIPLESKWWSNGARQAIIDIEKLGVDIDALYVSLFQDHGENFSWRMIFEMLDCARDIARVNSNDVAGMITAAHKWLEEKQYDTARAHLDRLLGADAPKELDAITMSEVIASWFSENWETIPEVEF